MYLNTPKIDYVQHMLEIDSTLEFSIDTLVFSKVELPLSWHKQTEIIQIISGEGEFIISGRSYRVRSGSFVIINQNQIHSAHSNLDRPLTYHSVKFSYNYFDSSVQDTVYSNYILPLLKGESYLPNTIITTFPIHEKVTKIFSELETNIREKKFGFEVYNKVLMYKLIYLFYSNNFIYHKSDKVLNKKSSSDIVKKTIDMIHKRYDEEMSLDFVASSLETSKPHLCRVFKRLTGQTITEYHNNYRIKQACEMLIISDDSISKIAFDLGYSNISYFHKRFKLKTGLTPNEYKIIYKKS